MDKERGVGSSLPANWPKDVPLPTATAARSAIQAAGEMVKGWQRARANKLLRTDKDMESTYITRANLV